MCELEGEQMETAVSDMERASKTWFALVGACDEWRTPAELTHDEDFARAQCVVHSAKYPSLGPWRIVKLVETP